MSPPFPSSSPEEGYLGDSHRSLRIREVFKYFRPDVDTPTAEAPRTSALGPLPESSPLTSVASYDPVLVCFTNLTARILNCRRAMITVASASKSYLIAESTQSLSLNSPHTHDPGDQLWLGCGTVMPSGGTLCELTIGLIPSPDADQEFIYEVNDLAEHPVYRDAPFVTGWPHKRYYCAAPLRTPNGVSIGTLCVFDEHPKPDGLTEDQKITLSGMSDIVMNYLETKQGKKDLQKSRAMEMGLSRFIAEGFLPGEGIEMTERRDGRLLERKELEARRLKELERKKMVERKRLMFQQRKFAEMMRERNADVDTHQRSGTTNLPVAAGAGTGAKDDAGKRIPQYPLLCMNPSNTEHVTELSLMDTMTFPSTMPRPLPSPSPETHSAYRQSDTLLTPPASTSSSSYFNGKLEGSHYFDGACSSAQSCSGSSEQACRRQSAYEKTSSFEPQFRSMFYRAATLIRSSIDADVVFLDGDLEGFFGPEACDKPNSCGLAHISTDKEAEQATRAERPRACRRRSGILGYATSNGSSNDSGGSHNIEDLGFDVAELNEEILNKLVEENEQGRIVALVDDSEEWRREVRSQKADDTQTDSILQRFLPGAKSIILVPLFDPNHKLFAVCFAWTTSATKTFSGDVEGSFVTAVANCIMAESTRLTIFNADKAKGEFISSISHELRSPLHGILASAQFLAESNVDPYQRSFVETIVSCGTTLLDTINHVLDFQKLNSLLEKDIRLARRSIAHLDDNDDRVQIEKTVNNQKSDIDLSGLVQDIVEGVCLGSEFQQSTARAAGDPPLSGIVSREDGSQITVIIDIDHRDDGWVFYAHPAALKRVINNIAGNAMKYTESGWVRVRLRAEDMAPDAQGNKRAMVKLSVSDSGKGISREFLKTKLFTPFSQQNPLAAGAGLGMSIVRQIIDVMDGKIDVKSQVGKGTKVTVSVPLIHRVVPLTLNLSPSERVDDALDVRSLAAGMKIRMVGFQTFLRTQAPCPMADAANFLRNSIERYVTVHFGMKIHDDESRSLDDVDIIIANEGEGEDDVLRELGAGNAPVIVLCSHPPVDGGASRFAGRVSTFVRKPCGPKKFARALAFCLDEMRRQDNSSEYDTANEEFSAYSDEEDDDVANESESASVSSSNAPSTPPSATAIDSFFGTKVTRWQAPRRNAASDTSSSSSSIGSVSGRIALPPLKRTPALPSTTTGTLTLPTTTTTTITTATTADTTPAPAPTKPSVLAVEDNRINLMLLVTFLRKNGYPFDTAVDGLEALEKVKAKDGGYDIILMDLQMPIMSGIESTREIRRYLAEQQQQTDEEAKTAKKQKRSFIVALTGLDTASDQREAFSAGVDSFMVKPVNFRGLEKTLCEGLKEQDKGKEGEEEEKEGEGEEVGVGKGEDKEEGKDKGEREGKEEGEEKDKGKGVGKGKQVEVQVETRKETLLVEKVVETRKETVVEVRQGGHKHRT
ncbi:hypothetical protein BZA05DRAFT_457825 [Tricharina praecox]|uniref:uncharacterized protein n=1 Tax=Tricharina praecox TaxID=43433 RepID=UPI00222012AC|nr:uncharacterized protein BZA05DRAFT_457825 [Tricharina praecox]KAI5846832.1 hypothetical protein BZA05DRAFT_457825 [Tricharina praecox]